MVSAAAAASASWETWSTTVAVRVTDGSALGEVRELIARRLAAIDRACSRFRADSELTRVNEARGRWTGVQPLLIEALEVALRAAQLTGGDVDPTVGRALELAGYDRDFSLLTPPAAAGDEAARPAPRLRLQARSRPGWRAIELDRPRGAVRVPAGVRLDLGATAKAWAADRAAREASEATGCGVLVAIGGDIATAGPPPQRGWAVRVTDDHRAGIEAPGQTVTIRSGGLATSSTAVRRWRHGGATMHHIIDPRTGRPAAGRWRTVSVAAADCTDANIAATAMIAGRSRTAEWLELQHLPARLVDNAGQVRTVAGWPAASRELAA